MATGLIALLDDIAAIAKLAAASSRADRKGGCQSCRSRDRRRGRDPEICRRPVPSARPADPHCSRVAEERTSLLLPAGLFLGYFAPWAITPLLMIGGVYLCYEGAEKLYEAFVPHDAHIHEIAVSGTADPATLENQPVSHPCRHASRRSVAPSRELAMFPNQ